MEQVLNEENQCRLFVSAKRVCQRDFRGVGRGVEGGWGVAPLSVSQAEPQNLRGPTGLHFCAALSRG